jgi:hypothetical protein
VEDLAQALYGEAGWSTEVVDSLFTSEQLRALARELELPSYSQKADLVRAVMEKIG